MTVARPDPADLAAFLNGVWAVRRTINAGAPAAAPSGRFTGTAWFSAGAVPRTTWRETGTLTLGAYTGPAQRTLLLIPAAASGAWRVSFEDERPFHELDLRAGRWQAEHLCGPDVYRGLYELCDEDHLTVNWHVTGPGRDDVIATDYRRLGDPDGVRARSGGAQAPLRAA
jgi:hypothetical protein